MKEILQRLLNKRGIKSIDELEKEEKETFESWQATLSKDELTVEDIKIFLQSQIAIIENKWRDPSENQSKKAEFIPYHTCYKLLLAAIESPKSNREALEKNLNQLLK